MELVDHSNLLPKTQPLKGDLKLESTTTPKSDEDIDPAHPHATTARELERLVPSGSSIQNSAADLQGDSVKEGLLGGSDAEKEWRCSPSSWDWKKLLLLISLWWAYFLINGAHSMIAPFFPNQVME